MKFALVNGQRQEARPGLRGECRACGSPMVAKCGEIKVRHWAHKGRRNCDPWWENETEWHRNWKNQFPDHWQEVVQFDAEDGEKHIADVKTDDGWVLEFQHSYIQPEERRSRDAFYPKLIWVVDGLRRKRDKKQFREACERSTLVFAKSPVRRVTSGGGALLRDWTESRTHVFFDFGDEHPLWWLWHKGDDVRAYVAPITRADFIEIHGHTATQGARDFDSIVKIFSKVVKYDELRGKLGRVQELNRSLAHSARRRVSRRRFRF